MENNLDAITVLLPEQTKLQRTWTDVRTDDPNRTMLDWLSTFYDVILSTWHTEVCLFLV